MNILSKLPYIYIVYVILDREQFENTLWFTILMPIGIKHSFALYQVSKVYMDTTILKPGIAGRIFPLLPL